MNLILNLTNKSPAPITPTRNRTSGNSYAPISPVGIFSFNNIAEFKPIEIGQVQPQPYEKDSSPF